MKPPTGGGATELLARRHTLDPGRDLMSQRVRGMVPTLSAIVAYVHAHISTQNIHVYIYIYVFIPVFVYIYIYIHVRTYVRR